MIDADVTLVWCRAAKLARSSPEPSALLQYFKLDQRIRDAGSLQTFTDPSRLPARVVAANNHDLPTIQKAAAGVSKDLQEMIDKYVSILMNCVVLHPMPCCSVLCCLSLVQIVLLVLWLLRLLLFVVLLAWLLVLAWL
jgi:hypothetical protein